MKISCNGSVLADKARVCDNTLSRTRGLMFSRHLKKGGGLILKADKEGKPDTAIHMFFVFFGIDAVWVNNKMEVVDVKKNIKPFTPLITPRKPARYVIELPKGAAKSVKTGDSIVFS